MLNTETYPCPSSVSTLSISTVSITPSITSSSILTTTVSRFTTTKAPYSINEPTPIPTNIATITGNGEQTPLLPTVNKIDVTDRGDINDISTTGSLLPVVVSGGSNNLGELIAGAIVAILAVLVLATLLIITIIFIFKRRRIIGKRADTFGITHSRVGFSNKNYERLGLMMFV